MHLSTSAQVAGASGVPGPRSLVELKHGTDPLTLEQTPPSSRRPGNHLQSFIRIHAPGPISETVTQQVPQSCLKNFQCDLSQRVAQGRCYAVHDGNASGHPCLAPGHRATSPDLFPCSSRNQLSLRVGSRGSHLAKEQGRGDGMHFWD